jgi:hypothetical protein
VTTHHQRRRVLRRDDPRRQRLPEDRVGVFQVRLPEMAPLTHQRVFAGDAVDEDVDAVVFAGDPSEQRLHLGLDRVIDANGDCLAASGIDHCRGLVDCFSTLVGRRPPFHTAPRAIHRGTRLAEGAGNTAAGAARGPGHHGHLPRQRLPWACGHYGRSFYDGLPHYLRVNTTTCSSSPELLAVSVVPSAETW